MGYVLESCIAEREDCCVAAGIDLAEGERAFPVYTDPEKCSVKADAIIDFSSPASLENLLGHALRTKTPVVIATTGYNEEQIARIKAAAQEIPVFFSFNMSLGINLLAELARMAAAFLGSQFDVEIVEKHHHRKVDAPSGTALMLADALNEALGGGRVYVYDRHSVRRPREPQEIGIHSVRGGTIVGEHEIIFAGRDEVITLGHSAASREIFAVGAINAAVYLSGVTAPGLYDMSKLLQSRSEKEEI